MTAPQFGRTQQCEGCPWKTSVDLRDIPSGHDPKAVKRLLACRAVGLRSGFNMACHDSPVGQEQACVGWLVNQLGPGNNFGLRIAAVRGEFDPGALEIEGEQHESIDDMCAVLSYSCYSYEEE